jgi:hypothetical protein
VSRHAALLTADIRREALVSYRVLNAIEKLWQFMRDNILSHRLFDQLDHIIDACCKAWNRIRAEPGRIRSTCGYHWASQVKI